MATENEPAKLLLPYLQRADELQKHEPLVAYYCRLYAMERGLRIPQSDRTKTTNALLVSLMKQLEKDKKSLKLGPDDNLHLEGFASSVFAKADKQDRAGRADLNTAKTFYAASIFLEILNQFGELQPDLEQKQKYAAWKAANIRKALKEGRNPLPGPPEEEKDPSFPSRSGEFELEPTGSYSASMPDPSWTTADPTARTQAYDEDTNLQQPTIFSRQPSILSRSPSSSTSPPSHYPNTNNNNYPPPHDLPSYYSYPNFQSYPGFTESSLSTAPTTTQHPSFYQGYDVSSVNLLPSNAAPYASSNGTNGIGIVPEAPAASRKYEYDSSYQPLPEKIAEAHKAARFAVGALAFDDVFGAVDHLKKALELLTNPSAGH